MKIGDRFVIKDATGVSFLAEITGILASSPDAPTTVSIDPNKPIGLQLKQLREEKGLIQKQVADRAELTEATLSRIETGETARPHKRNVRAILLAIQELSSRSNLTG